MSRLRSFSRNFSRKMVESARWRLAPPGRTAQERELLAQWRAEELAPFRGWDYSYLDGRMEYSEADWDYPGLASSHVHKSSAVLDMGTGGGELFRDILTPRPAAKCFACEGYRKNLPVARAMLAGLDVTVLPMKNARQLPFSDGSFDLVLNRLDGFDARELKRILSPGGVFITEQIGVGNYDDLCAEFGGPPKWRRARREQVPDRLLDAGFVLQRNERWAGETVFWDVGALVYFLKTIPWLVPGFSVLRFSAELLELHKRCTRDGKLTFTSTRQLLLARKP